MNNNINKEVYINRCNKKVKDKDLNVALKVTNDLLDNAHYTDKEYLNSLKKELASRGALVIDKYNDKDYNRINKLIHNELPILIDLDKVYPNIFAKSNIDSAVRYINLTNPKNDTYYYVTNSDRERSIMNKDIFRNILSINLKGWSIYFLVLVLISVISVSFGKIPFGINGFLNVFSQSFTNFLPYILVGDFLLSYIDYNYVLSSYKNDKNEDNIESNINSINIEKTNKKDKTLSNNKYVIDVKKILTNIRRMKGYYSDLEIINYVDVCKKIYDLSEEEIYLIDKTLEKTVNINEPEKVKKLTK